MEITKERLLKIQSWSETYGPGSNVVLPAEEAEGLARIALASLEAEPVAYIIQDKADRKEGNRGQLSFKSVEQYHEKDINEHELTATPLYTAPPAMVSVPEFAPIAYIFKHPAGRLFWSLTDESNKGQSDVMPVYSAPVPAFVPPAIEPDYEVIKGILPTANPDEYACCIAADMWNACRAAMLQGADGNSPVIPDSWALVPVELTPDMRSAWDSAPHTDDDDHDMQVAYRTMIAASPQQEVK